MDNNKYEKIAKYINDFDEYVLPWLIQHKCNNITQARIALIREKEEVKYRIFDNLIKAGIVGKEYISSALWAKTRKYKNKY